MIHCVHCKQEIDDDSIYCMYCGKQVAQKKRKLHPYAEKLLAAVIILFTAAILTVSGIIGLRLFEDVTRPVSVSAPFEDLKKTESTSATEQPATAKPQKTITPSVVSKDITATFSSSDQTAFNMFMSCLPQSGMPSLNTADDPLDIEAVLDCAYVYIAAHSKSKIEKNEDTVSISKRTMVTTVKQLFGVELKPDSVGKYVFANDMYYTTNAVSPKNYVVQLENVLDNQDDTFTADVSVYSYDKFSSELYRPKDEWNDSLKTKHAFSAVITFENARRASQRSWTIIEYSR